MGRSPKTECLAGFALSIGCAPRLGPRAYARTDRFEPSERVRREEADRVVDSRGGLVAALDDHGPGEVVWVDGDVDLRGESGLVVRDVTLASGYGMDDQPTGRLHTDSKPAPLLRAEDGARLTGLKIHGDEFEYFDPQDRHPGVDGAIYRVGASVGVRVTGDGVELDDLELAGWTHAAVNVDRSGRTDTSTHVHHLDVVDNPAGSLGYGVLVRAGTPLVEHAYFDNNRHSVAGTGAPDCGYLLRFNVVCDHGTSHAIDMHGRKPAGADGPIAGRRFVVRDNVVKLRRSHLTGTPQPALKVRGRPLEGGLVQGNWFFNPNGEIDNENPESAIRQIHAPRYEYDNLDVRENVFGVDGR